jgi:hypothetical protein
MSEITNAQINTIVNVLSTYYNTRVVTDANGIYYKNPNSELVAQRFGEEITFIAKNGDVITKQVSEIAPEKNIHLDPKTWNQLVRILNLRYDEWDRRGNIIIDRRGNQVGRITSSTTVFVEGNEYDINKVYEQIEQAQKAIETTKKRIIAKTKKVQKSKPKIEQKLPPLSHVIKKQPLLKPVTTVPFWVAANVYEDGKKLTSLEIARFAQIAVKA